jgi:phosphoserine phosphatase RsbU/P
MSEDGVSKRTEPISSENIGFLGIPSVLMRRALSATAEGITISDPSLPDNPLIYVNEGFETLTGYTAQEVLGRNCRFLQGHQTDPLVAEEIRTAIREQRPCLVELINHRKDGTAFWNRLSITPVRDSAGHLTHFIGVQSDITNRKNAEDALGMANEQLLKANEDMKRALESAAKVQMALLPHGFRGGNSVRVAWRLEACATLAGDILNVFWLDDRYLGCYILDVMGHGISAALLSVTLSHFLSPQSKGAFLVGSDTEGKGVESILSPAQVGYRLNQRFQLDGQKSQFFTILYGILDTTNGIFRYLNAGHPPMIYLPRSGEPTLISTSGFPVGVVDVPEYEDHVLELKSGDRLFIYSDGMVEVENPEGEQFGTESLRNAIHMSKSLSLSDSLDDVFSQIKSWSAGNPLRDDVSILALEIP